tara:strand:- start:615 stop:1250 length:636 start_codon:yes stop_codon:yes gene_type:complete
MTENTVFKTLSTIKIDKKDIKKKKSYNRELSYISWATAWHDVSEVYPDITYNKKLSDIDGFVSVSVTIEGKTLTEEFPILDNVNKSAEKPDSFQINTAFQRGLVKCLGMFGYGLFIYKGEDLPPDDVSHETIEKKSNLEILTDESNKLTDENDHLEEMEKEGYRFAIDNIKTLDELEVWGKNNATKINNSNHADYVRKIYASKRTELNERV